MLIQLPAIFLTGTKIIIKQILLISACIEENISP